MNLYIALRSKKWTHGGLFRRFWMESLYLSVALQSRLLGKEKFDVRLPYVRIGLSRVINLIVLIKAIHRPAFFWVHTYADCQMMDRYCSVSSNEAKELAFGGFASLGVSATSASSR
jgi:hypothetical protein